jgi:flagellar assembly protein FliH
MQNNAARAPDNHKPASYGFDLDLSSVGGRPGAVRGLVPRQEYEAELARARDEARKLGLTEASAAAEARIAESASRIATAAAQVLSTLDRECEVARRDAAALAITTARTLARTLIDARPLAEIEALIESCLGPLRAVPHLVIRLRAADADALRRRLEPLAEHAGFSGRIVVLAEEAMPAGDCRIEWGDGGIVRDREKALAAIEAAVDRRFAAAGGLSAIEAPADVGTEVTK